MESLAIVTGFINHYNILMADELYRQLGNSNFYFIETSQLTEERRKTGFEEKNRPYIIKALKDYSSRKKAMDICLKADVLLVDTELHSMPYKLARIKKGLFTIEYSERPLKRGWINFFSKTNLWNQLYYHILFYKMPVYRLCVGAYVANDLYAMHSYRNRCYKFGYFPGIESLDVDKILSLKQKDKFKILWCARFIQWKHPEMMPLLAQKLVKEGVDFEINMVGEGPLLSKIRKETDDKGLTPWVKFIGGVPNSEVIAMMRSHHIFILTSDKREGWGVVINEAMANCCCVVASDTIGSVPVLIEDGINGSIFKTGCVKSLFYSTIRLVKNRELRENMTRSAYKTISEGWSPQIAACRLLLLADNLRKGLDSIFDEGICSKALPQK